LNFCSACGSPISRRLVLEDTRARYACLSCGATHYQNPSVIVVCCVHCRDKVLMCCRAHPPAQGQWAPPSGYLECGETLEEAAARETLEETGVQIDPAKLELYAVINMTAIDQIAITFRGEVSSMPPVHPGPECFAVEFLSQEEVSRKELAWRDSIGRRSGPADSRSNSAAFDRTADPTSNRVYTRLHRTVRSVKAFKSILLPLTGRRGASISCLYAID
jgi:ADP-ribose pyrophosphatase YjhB (NUDIX family)